MDSGGLTASEQCLPASACRRHAALGQPLPFLRASACPPRRPKPAHLRVLQVVQRQRAGGAGGQSDHTLVRAIPAHRPQLGQPAVQHQQRVGGAGAQLRRRQRLPLRLATGRAAAAAAGAAGGEQRRGGVHAEHAILAAHHQQLPPAVKLHAHQRPRLLGRHRGAAQHGPLPGVRLQQRVLAVGGGVAVAQHRGGRRVQPPRQLPVGGAPVKRREVGAELRAKVLRNVAARAVAAVLARAAVRRRDAAAAACRRSPQGVPPLAGPGRLIRIALAGVPAREVGVQGGVQGPAGPLRLLVLLQLSRRSRRLCRLLIALLVAAAVCRRLLACCGGLCCRLHRLQGRSLQPSVQRAGWSHRRSARNRSIVRRGRDRCALTGGAARVAGGRQPVLPSDQMPPASPSCPFSRAAGEV